MFIYRVGQKSRSGKVYIGVTHFPKPKTTQSSKYYARKQTAVARGLAWPARRLTGRQTASASKHSLSFFSSVSE